MAVRTITTSIALDGEQKFKQQIAEVNSNLKNLKTEMKYTEAVFKGQEDSTEALTKKSELLRDEIEQQVEKVKALEGAVKDAAEVYGDSSTKTDKWRQQLTNAKTDLVKMQNELKDTETALKRAEDGFDDCADAIDDMGEQAEENGGILSKLRDGIDKYKGAIAGGMVATVAIEGAKEVAEAILDLEESTREYRTMMGNLEVSSQQAGYTAEQTEEAYKRLYGVLGDAQTTATTVANLQAIGLEQGDLLTLIDQTTGAWGRYGDSIPIDGLAESINETVKANEVTGTLADVLNWGTQEGETFGVMLKDNIEFTELSNKELEKLTEQERLEYEAKKEQYEATEEYNQSVQDATTAEEFFNIALQNCQTEAERADLILQTMSKMGLTQAGESWRDLNEDIVEANESQDRMESAMGRLGEAVAPAANAIRNVGASAIEFLADVIEGAIGLIEDFFGWWDRFINTDTEKEVSDRRAAARGVQTTTTTTTKTVKYPEKIREHYGMYEAGGDNAAWVDGSHAHGLARVPFDGYRAELHEGEAVLTAEESKAWNAVKKLADSRDEQRSTNLTVEVPGLEDVSALENAMGQTIDNLAQLRDEMRAQVIQQEHSAAMENQTMAALTATMEDLQIEARSVRMQSAALQNTMRQVGETINITVQSVLDGRQVGESVTRYQRNNQRAVGR